MATDIMVDIETTGLNPAVGNMIQLSAVKFNLAEPFDAKSLTADTQFDRCLQMLPNRTWEQGTARFWTAQRPGLLASILARGEPVGLILDDFLRWIAIDTDVSAVRLWAKPIPMEWGFLKSYYEQFGMQMPFKHNKCRDVYTYVEAITASVGLNMFEMSDFTGSYTLTDKHNALHDVVSTIEYMYKVKELCECQK